ncbi:hypothetical protein JCGZ_07707 [Jatropha curcas]|uniref:Uncharacterized protein n=1 Tax=Jatropha curcas TaxID=180498 RepID=A0A067KD33_JATCU|nr:hypothetical protein JCGZ_07707 [Jatropha curcas]
MGRAPCCDKANVKRGPWSPEEDAALKRYLQTHGTAGNWIALPQKAGLKRCGKSCRLRWLNYLRPDIKHGGFTEEEDNIIFSLYNQMETETNCTFTFCDSFVNTKEGSSILDSSTPPTNGVGETLMDSSYDFPDYDYYSFNGLDLFDQDKAASEIASSNYCSPSMLHTNGLGLNHYILVPFHLFIRCGTWEDILNNPPLQPRTTQIVTSPPSCTAATILRDTPPDLLLSERLSTQGTTCRFSFGLGPVVTPSHRDFLTLRSPLFTPAPNLGSDTTCWDRAYHPTPN